MMVYMRAALQYAPSSFGFPRTAYATTGCVALAFGAFTAIRLSHSLFSTSSTSSPPPSASPPPIVGYNPYTLIKSEEVTPDTKVLRFALPEGVTHLNAPLPSCLKVKQELPVGKANALVTLDKSYSPISYPDQEGYLELLVKGYPPRPADHAPTHGGAGGLGAWLVGLEVGEAAMMKIKSPRLFHGEPYYPNRWTKLGFVAGGTGVAPLMQLIRAILADEEDHTSLSLVFANRHEKDIMLKQEFDGLALLHPTQFRVHYVLSDPPSNWSGGTGWVTADDLLPRILHLPQKGTMVMVCGRDEFVDTVSGRTKRAPPPPGKKRGPKIQGELTGLLKSVGFKETEVFKF